MPPNTLLGLDALKYSPRLCLAVVITIALAVSLLSPGAAHADPAPTTSKYISTHSADWFEGYGCYTSLEGQSGDGSRTINAGLRSPSSLAQ